jgi:hypothetical protein
MHLRGGCRDDVTICRNGVNSSHNVTLDCPAPTCPTGGGGGGGGVPDPCEGVICGAFLLESSGDACCPSPILIDVQTPDSFASLMGSDDCIIDLLIECFILQVMIAHAFFLWTRY